MQEFLKDFQTNLTLISFYLDFQFLFVASRNLSLLVVLQTVYPNIQKGKYITYRKMNTTFIVALTKTCLISWELLYSLSIILRP